MCQDVLRKLLEVLPSFDPNGSAQFTTWMFVVAHRAILDVRKRRHLAIAPLEDAVELADPVSGPARAVERRELRDALEEAIGALPEAQRRTFILAEVHDHPLEAIAKAEGIAVGTVKSRLHRARALLAQWLEGWATPSTQASKESSHARRS